MGSSAKKNAIEGGEVWVSSRLFRARNFLRAVSHFVKAWNRLTRNVFVLEIDVHMANRNSQNNSF